MYRNHDRQGFKTLLQLSESELTDENQQPAFYLSRPEIQSINTLHTKSSELSDVQLRYFKMPKLTSYPLDLNKGFEQHIFRERPTQMNLLDKVIKFILNAEENVLQPDKSAKAQTINSKAASESGKSSNSKRKLVLTQRGVLARIMITPYKKRNDTFYATRYCSILHLADLCYFNGRTQNDTYHGKFEQMCFSDDPDLEPITDIPVDDSITTFAVFRSNVKEFDLLYSAEISGVLSEHKIIDTHNMEEINKTKIISTKLLWGPDKDDIFNNPKSLLWWAQLYLANTNDICIGIKDRNGIVRTPVHMKRVQDIPKNQNWKPKICIRFLNTMLTLVEETMSKVNCPHTVYEFKYDSQTKCIKSKIHAGKTNYSFLPDDYIEYCKKHVDRKIMEANLYKVGA